MVALKHQSRMYRNINGTYFKCYTSDPSEFNKLIEEAKENKLKYRVLDGALYLEFKNKP